MAHSRPTGGQPSVVLDHDAIQHENLLLRELVTVYQRLTGLALQNADTATVARLVAERTSATVAVVSRGLEVIAVAGPGRADEAPAKNGATDEGAASFVRDHLASPRLGAVLRSTGQTRRSLRLPDVGGGVPVVVVPILVADDVPAYLVTFGGSEEGPGGDLNLLVAEHAATICGVMLGRERVVAAAARQVRDDLVEGLLLGGGRDNGEVTRWARHLGYEPAVDHRVLAVALDTSAAARSAESAAAAWQRAAVAVEQFFTLRLAETITSIRADEVVVVLPDGQPPGSQHLAEGCVARMRDLFGDAVVTIGIGGTCREPAEIARSYGQARRTIDALARLGRQGEVVAFEELGIHRLLLQVPDLLELRAFATEVLGPLSAADRQRGTELLATLSCYFRENGSPQRTAQSLHVHPNTVTYRLRRIRAITGLQLDTYRDRLMAQVALEIYHALGTDPLAPERSPS
jgi:sugar diacid utilization regulator